jgi:hypothetical protein
VDGHLRAYGGAVVALADGIVDLGGRLFRSLGGALGEGPDFLGDDGEAHAGLAGAGRLDGGVEGEDVGLERDFVDGLDDFGDAVAGGF